MPEPGDNVDRAYRELPREEPPPSLDAAILAASRRAVGSRPEAAPRRGFAARWGGPVSIAAVLVLGIAVALRMQVEQPGIETSMPQREAPAVIPKAIEAPATVEAPKADVARAPERGAPASSPVPAPAPAPKPALRAAKPTAHSQPEASGTSSAEAVARERKEERAMAAPQAFAPEPPVVQSAPVPALPPMVQASPAPAAMAEQRLAPTNIQAAPPMKRSAAADVAAPSGGAAAARASEAAVTPEAELERIAKLRAEGRDDEADRALEAFRKKHPDYRIADAMWERVRRR